MEVKSQSELVATRCKACEGGIPKYSKAEAEKQLRETNSSWQINDEGTMITRTWKMKNFVQALQRINQIGQLAEDELHHPDIHLTGYRILRIDIMTHAIKGLSENDFILAAKIDALDA